MRNKNIFRIKQTLFFGLFFRTLFLINYYIQAENLNCTKHESISFFALNNHTNKVLIDRNSSNSLPPASVLKLITTATILELYGPDYTFKTILSYDGEIDNYGTLNGNIYIEFGNDPCLKSINFKNHYKNLFENWLNKIKDLGIVKINGLIIAETSPESILPDSWAWSDLNKCYGTQPTVLSFCDNIIEIYFKASKNNTVSIIKTYPVLPLNVKIINKLKLDEEKNIAAEYQNNSNIILRGTLPLKQNQKIKIPMKNPPHWLVSSFISILVKNQLIPNTVQPKVTIKSNISKKRNIIYKTISPPLKEIIKYTNKLSINSYAEQLLAQICFYYTRQYNPPNKRKIINWFWQKKGIDTSGMYIHDGSGLSRYNAIDTKTIVNILNYMINKSIYKNQYINSIGSKGTYGVFGKNYFYNTQLENNLIGKAGGLKRINSFAGYLTNPNKNYIPFAIIVYNHAETRQNVNKKIEKKLLNLLNNSSK